jgi:hypothetical protein
MSWRDGNAPDLHAQPAVTTCGAGLTLALVGPVPTATGGLGTPLGGQMRRRVPLATASRLDDGAGRQLGDECNGIF